MSKARLAISHLFTALLIPCIVIAAINIDPTFIQMYQRYELEPIELFWVWRAGVILFIAIAAIWIASRAINPQPGNAISIAAGLVICAAFLFSMPYYVAFSDEYGMLACVLTCIYLCSLITTLVGRLIA